MAGAPKSTNTNFDIEVVNRNSRESFCTAFRKEFTRKNLGFNFSRTDVFTTSQWHFPRLVFVVYRLVVAAYTVSIVFYTVVEYNFGNWYRMWPLWLTTCSYFMLTCHLLCSAVIAVMSSCDQPSVSSSEPLPFYIKLSWFLYVVASSAALLVTLLFYVIIVALFGVIPIGSRHDHLHVHVINSVLVILEVAISAIPVRLLHFVYVLAYCAVYVSFSAICWAYDHSWVLYPRILDWNYPVTTLALVLVVVIVLIPALQFILFAAYYLRLKIYNRIYQSKVHAGN